jgi:hypothetical protein
MSAKENAVKLFIKTDSNTNEAELASLTDQGICLVKINDVIHLFHYDAHFEIDSNHSQFQHWNSCFD